MSDKKKKKGGAILSDKDWNTIDERIAEGYKADYGPFFTPKKKKSDK